MAALGERGGQEGLGVVHTRRHSRSAYTLAEAEVSAKLSIFCMRCDSQLANERKLKRTKQKKRRSELTEPCFYTMGILINLNDKQQVPFCSNDCTHIGVCLCVYMCLCLLVHTHQSRIGESINNVLDCFFIHSHFLQFSYSIRHWCSLSHVQACLSNSFVVAFFSFFSHAYRHYRPSPHHLNVYFSAVLCFIDAINSLLFFRNQR